MRLLCFTALILAAISTVLAQPFHVDSTFATNGYFISPMPGWDRASDLAIQPDCKIVTVGHVGTFFNGTCAVSRFLPDGSLDPSFGLNGVSTFSLAGNDQLNCVKLQPDGKIVVAGGKLNGALGVARLLPSGMLDPSFGNGGKVVFPVSTPKLDAPATGLAIQSDGKILIATQSDAGNGQNDNMSVLVKLMPDGTLDATFADNGKLFLDIYPGLHELIDVLILNTDGMIYLAARHFAATNSSPPVLVRLFSDGTLDPSFGIGGLAPLIIGIQFYDIKVMPNGKILGLLYFDFSTFLARFSPNGSLDLSFGVNGMINLDPSFPVSVGGFKLILQNDEKIIVGGTQTSFSSAGSPPFSYYVVRFNPDATYDTTFASEGHLFPDLDGNGEILNGIVPHGTGFIGVGATRNALNQTDLVVFRLENGIAPLPPAPSFTAIQNGLTVSFTNTSVGATDYLWDFGDGQISSLFETEHTYANSGTYEVKLTAYNKCVAAESAQTISVPITGIIETVGKNGFSVFPNPNNGSFAIEVNIDKQSEINCCLVNSTGQMVGCRYLTHGQGSNRIPIDFGQVSQGIYTLKIKSKEKTEFIRLVVIQ